MALARRTSLFVLFWVRGPDSPLLLDVLSVVFAFLPITALAFEQTRIFFCLNLRPLGGIG